MMSQSQPTPEAILDRMRATLGTLPPAIQKAATADPRMLVEQARSSAFAMPEDDAALSPQTRTLVYLAVALATGNRACTLAMLGKARGQRIRDAQLLEAFHIARYAQATQVLGNAEPLFDLLNARPAATAGGSAGSEGEAA